MKKVMLLLCGEYVDVTGRTVMLLLLAWVCTSIGLHYVLVIGL